MPPQAPAPAPTPTPQPAAPAPGPAPAAPEQVTPNMPPISAPSGVGGSSKKVWIIGAIVAVLIVVMAATVVALYFMFFSPAAVTKRVSNEFMNAAAAGDTQTLYEITNSTTEAEKAFIDSAAAATKGEFTLKDGTMQNGTGYYLYDLTNEQGKMGRTTVEKKDGKYVVTGYVFGSDNLALVPGSSTTQEPVTPPTEPAPVAAATKPCVTESQVKAQFPTTAGSDNEMDGETTYFIETIFFQAKSTAYDFDLTDEYLDKVAAGYKKLADGEFTINLKAKVSSNANTAEVNKLADDRAAKIRADLVSRGVPSDRILEEEPENNDSGTYGDSSERNVDIRIVTPYPCN